MDLRRDPLDATMTGTPVRLAAGALGGIAVVWLTWDDSDLGDRQRRWAWIATIAVAVTVAWLLPVLARLLPERAAVPVVLALVLAAVYACVPETDQVAPVLVAIGAIAAVELVTRTQLPWWWHGALAWLVLWAGIHGATGRQSALIGALFAWWPVALPVFIAQLARDLSRKPAVVRWTPVVLGAVAAFVVARTGGVAATGAAAARSAAIAGPASLALTWLLVGVRVNATLVRRSR
jgi:hypothetical protein